MRSDVVDLGQGIVLTPDCIRQLKHAEVYPIGLQHQQTINEEGKFIPKKRISHNPSNKKNIGLSINQRVNKDLLPSVLYGSSLLRLIHLINNIRKNNPNTPTLQQNRHQKSIQTVSRHSNDSNKMHHNMARHKRQGHWSTTHQTPFRIITGICPLLL
jgi:hypothetical protein